MSADSTFKNMPRTDWKRLRRQRDEDIDFSDIPELTPEAFARAIVRGGMKPLVRKEQVTLRLDADVLAWFRAQGKGYQTRINDLRRAFVEAQRQKP